jgi:hypothetical protein
METIDREDEYPPIEVGQTNPAPAFTARNTSSWSRRTAFSASSRAFDLHGETKMARID